MIEFAEAPCPGCNRAVRFLLSDEPEDPDAAVTVACECGEIFETELWVEWVPDGEVVEA